jgi:hypothetical protein
MVKRLARRGSVREMSLLVVELLVTSSWLRTRFDRGLVLFGTNRKRFRLWDSLETGFHGSSSYPTRPVPRRVAARRTRAPRAHQCGQRGHGCRTLVPDTGHRTRTRTPGIGHRALDTGHRTPDARTPDADTGHLPDAGHWTGECCTRDADGGRGQATKVRWHPDILAPRHRWDAEPRCCGRRRRRRSAT